MTGMTPVFCAIDTPDLARAQKLSGQVQAHIYGLKLGLEFFMALGATGYRALAASGLPVFLDVKLHDIPNTVAGAVGALLPLKPSFLTVHSSGGATMMRAAAETAAKAGTTRPMLLGITVLTSLDTRDLGSVGQNTDTKGQVIRLAGLAKDSGLDGIVCSPEEVRVLRQALGPEFILMVPGIRPVWASANDQKRIMTPREAIEAGATYLVIGRPITGADNPSEAARRIAEELDCGTSAS
jgi:orotidine-5'-phosphate decarboxylase